MHLRILATVFPLLFSNNLKAQDKSIAQEHMISDIRNILSGRDLAALQSEVKTLQDANWKYFRDIAPNFREGVFFVKFMEPLDDSSSLSTEFCYKVDIIASQTKITYYNVSEVKYKKEGEKWSPYYEKLDSFKDAVSYNALTTSFKTVFHVDIKENELFMADIVYGRRCGYDGTFIPKWTKQIDDLVAKKDKAELLKWLTSVNTEKQVYAIDGLSHLKLVKIRLTSDEQKIVDFVAHKKGNMQVCDGCIFESREITTVTKEFKL